MIEMTIGQQAYSIPEELTIQQWSDLIKWDFVDQANWPRIIHILTGHPYEDLKKTNPDGLELAIVFVSRLMMMRKEVPMTDPKNLTFGQWVDVEVYLAFGVEKHLNDVITILAPGRALMASEALWVLDRYTEFRTWLMRQYEGLFETDSLVASDEPSDPMQAAKFWYRIIVDLAGNDILKMDAVTDQPLQKTLNFLSLQKENKLAEERRQREQRLKNELHLRTHR